MQQYFDVENTPTAQRFDGNPMGDCGHSGSVIGEAEISPASKPRISPYAWVGMVDKPVLEHDFYSVIEVVCDKLKIESSQVYRRRRLRNVVMARQISMYMIKKATNASLKDIGEHFGGFDHTTVVHSMNTVEDLIDSDPDYRETINKIKKALWLTAL